VNNTLILSFQEDTQNSEMENLPFENGFTINTMRKHLHEQSVAYKKKQAPKMQVIFQGNWKVCLTLEKVLPLPLPATPHTTHHTPHTTHHTPHTTHHTPHTTHHTPHTTHHTTHYTLTHQHLLISF
jgi:hypothetical protein